MNEARSGAERARLLSLFEAEKRTDILLRWGLESGPCLLSGDGASALVIARGFIFLAGKADPGFFQAAMPAFPKGFLTFSGPAPWLSIARDAGARLAMTRWDLGTPAAFDTKKLQALCRLPEGYRLQNGDQETWTQCGQSGWAEDLGAWYPDGPSLAGDGLMTAAYAGEKLAAGCGVYAQWKEWVEIEVDTHPDHQRRGLATACAARFLLNCQEKGLRPHWDAMTPISAALAQKLGFLPGRPYPVVCRE